MVRFAILMASYALYSENILTSDSTAKRNSAIANDEKR